MANVLNYSNMTVKKSKLDYSSSALKYRGEINYEYNIPLTYSHVLHRVSKKLFKIVFVITLSNFHRRW